MSGDIQIRTELQPGDLGAVTEFHGRLYAQEYGWTSHFEAYVAESLAAFARDYNPREDRIWLAEKDGRLMGSIGIVRIDAKTAQLRWFLIAPESRGLGLGRKLIDSALAFSRETGAERVFLWTVSGLPAAAHLYRSAGFRLTEQKPSQEWGPAVIEERHDLEL